MSDDALEREIGQAAAERLRAKGWTIEPPKPPPEPRRLVTLEESRERYYRLGGAKEGFTYAQTAYNAADNWLVRTVNRRIIEGLPSMGLDRQISGCWWAPETALLRIFTGEETP